MSLLLLYIAVKVGVPWWFYPLWCGIFAARLYNVISEANE